MRQLGAVYPGALPPDGRGDDHPCAGRCLADGNIPGLTHYFDALSAGDVDAAVALVADDADFRSPMARIQGKDEIRAFLGGFDSAFPGARFEITHVIESGTSVAVEGVLQGHPFGTAHDPQGGSLSATGRDVSAPFVTMFDVEDGAVTSHRPYWDLAGFMTQLTG